MTNPTLRAQVALQQKMLGRLTSAGSEGTGRSHRRLFGVGVAASSLATPAMSVAAAPPAAPGAATCDGGRASGLQKIVGDAAKFLIVLGGATAVLMFVIGGFLIMTGGGSRKHVDRGMKTVKNAFIGLAVMVSGLFVRGVVVGFIGGASNDTSATACINDNTLK